MAVRSLPATLVLDRYRPLWPAIYWTLTLIGIAWIVGVFVGAFPFKPCSTGEIACDAYGFWSMDDTPYQWATAGPFRYSPAALWFFRPLQLVPWEVFLAGWIAAHVAVVLWLRAGWMLVIPGPTDDIFRGNTSVFLAAFLVLALHRSSAWWTPILLTKVAPGVGMVWHVVRREWRELAIALGVTGVIVLLGAVIAPNLWMEWIGTLLTTSDTYEIQNQFGPTPVRLLLAAGIVALGAWRGWAWVIPIAMLISLPGLWPYNWALLAAIPRLRQDEPSRMTGNSM